MLSFDLGSFRFNYRVAGICVHRGHVLLHRAESDGFWTVPGGRVEFGEPSRDALAREMREEIDMQVAVGRLLWVVENFFGYAGQSHHELGFYYEMVLPPGTERLDTSREFRGSDGGITLIYRWFPVDHLSETYLLPSFLRAALRCLPSATEHVVHTDVKK